MSSFLNDPEAQRRYEERFGKRDRPSEVHAPTETPAVRFGTGETYAQTIARQRAEHVDTTGREAIFAEPSASYSRLSERLKARQSGPVGGITWDTNDPNAGLGL